MIEPASWMAALAAGLRPAFGDRLLFLGLQGSYRRGEATEGSDIDVVTVLDTVTVADLRAYRSVVAGLPEGGKACGFLGGREELRRWPPHELFSLARDTDAFHGRLEPLLPPITDADIRFGARLAAGGLYHQAVHTYLYGDPAERPAAWAGLRKAAFFLMLPLEYLRSGVYAASRRALAPRLPERERAILTASPADDEAVERCFSDLLEWSGEVLRDI